eukprot:364981-Chlamydomonas_euryale.AAC.3
MQPCPYGYEVQAGHVLRHALAHWNWDAGCGRVWTLGMGAMLDSMAGSCCLQEHKTAPEVRPRRKPACQSMFNFFLCCPAAAPSNN